VICVEVAACSDVPPKKKKKGPEPQNVMPGSESHNVEISHEKHYKPNRERIV
jgi:hypothetical protein